MCRFDPPPSNCRGDLSAKIDCYARVCLCSQPLNNPGRNDMNTMMNEADAPVEEIRPAVSGDALARGGRVGLNAQRPGAANGHRPERSHLPGQRRRGPSVVFSGRHPALDPALESANMVPDEFGEIAARHYESLYKFAFSLTRAEADASDLTQQTFYLWAKKGHQLRDRSKVKTWLFTTLHRMFLEGRRRQTRFPHSSLDEVAPEDFPASSSSLDDHMDSAEVLKALAQVPQVYQGAVALFYLEDCSYREIAEILEVAEGTVKSRIARGITQLRHLMGCSASTRYRRTANPGNREETDCRSTP